MTMLPNDYLYSKPILMKFRYTDIISWYKVCKLRINYCKTVGDV